MAADKKTNFSIKRLIYNDKYLIIISLILALVIWITTSLNIGIDESKTIKVNVPIKLGDEVSEQLGMQYYSLHDTVDLSVTITGAKYVIGQVEEDDLSVKFDTSSISRTGEHTIPILVTNKSKNLDFDISAIYPQSVEGYFDVSESKTFDLYLKYDENNVAEGYTFGSPVLSEDKVIITGPKTYVDKIDRAVVNVNFDNNQKLTEPYSEDCKIYFEGSGVETSYLTITSKSDTTKPIKAVTVTLPVLKVKSLPVSVDFDDMPASLPNGIINVDYSINKIDAGVLDSADISSAVIGTINFHEIPVGQKTFTFDVTNLKGITLLDKNIKQIKAVVTVDNSYTMQNVSVSKNDIIVEGVPNGYKAVVSSFSSSYVNIVVPKALSDIKSSQIEIKCDVSKQNENNTYVASVDIKNNENSWVYGKYSAVIQLVKQ